MVEEQDGIWCESDVRVSIVAKGKQAPKKGEGNSPREQRDWTSNTFTAALKILEAPCP